MSFLFIISCLYFFLPAYFANMTPPLIARIKLFDFLGKPCDFNKKFRGKPILGGHKTWRGVIFAMLMGIFIVMLQAELFQFPAIQKISFFNYQQINIFVFALLISGGAVFGDLFFAFIKRRLQLKPGAKFLPFDQTNYVLGAALFLTPFLKIDIFIWVTIFILTFFLHIIFNRIGFLLGLHKAKW